MVSSATNQEDWQDNRHEEISCGSSRSIIPAIWGDSIVGQALVLLLRGSGYAAKFLPASFLDEPGALEDVQLLLLTPTPRLSIEQRAAFVASLRDKLQTAEIPVLELATHSGETRKARVRDESWYVVPWPCRIEELERCIEAALPTNHGAAPAACQESLTRGETKDGNT
jgi:hypothetical protein